MITDNRILKLLFQIFSAACVLAVVVCLICDFALNKGLGWSLYVLSAVPFVWLAASPLLLLKKWKTAVALGLFSVALLPYLYITARLTGHAWFSPLGLPVGITGLFAFWAAWLLLRYAKINKWYLSAALVFIFGVAVNGVVNAFVNLFLSQRLYGVSDIISLLACTAVSVLLCVIGYGGIKGNDDADDAGDAADEAKENE